jgi:predicted nuclease of predicted toxin-antitoxin system
VKLLLDENISQRLVALLLPTFPDCSHIELLLERGSSDTGIWQYAKANGLMIVSKDNDFRQRAFVLGPPPKVIWLDVGNARTSAVAALLLANIERIERFYTDPVEGLLVLSF